MWTLVKNRTVRKNILVVLFIVTGHFQILFSTLEARSKKTEKLVIHDIKIASKNIKSVETEDLDINFNNYCSCFF